MDPQDLGSLQIGIGAVISLLTGIIGAAGVWFSLKNRVEILHVMQTQNTEDIEDIKSCRKDANQVVHTRIDALKVEVKDNKDKADNALSEIKTEMSAMELRIINAIHEIKK